MGFVHFTQTQTQKHFKYKVIKGLKKSLGITSHGSFTKKIPLVTICLNELTAFDSLLSIYFPPHSPPSIIAQAAPEKEAPGPTLFGAGPCERAPHPRPSDPRAQGSFSLRSGIDGWASVGEWAVEGGAARPSQSSFDKILIDFIFLHGGGGLRMAKYHVGRNEKEEILSF